MQYNLKSAEEFVEEKWQEKKPFSYEGLVPEAETLDLQRKLTISVMYICKWSFTICQISSRKESLSSYYTAQF